MALTRYEEEQRNRQKLVAALSQGVQSQPSQATLPKGYDQLVAAMQPEKWYAGEMPTAGETLSRMYTMFGSDSEKYNQAYALFEQERENPRSWLYAPYRTATNKAFIQQLSDFGLDTRRVDDQFFSQYSDLQNYYKLSADGTPSKPGKRDPAIMHAAYAYWKLYQDEDRTKKAESEWQSLAQDLSYWAQRKDRNYSDEELIQRIDWNKYPTLAAMDEARTRGAPMMLNRAVEYSQDALKGLIWAARNGESGKPIDYYLTRQAQGEGQRYLPDPETKKRLDPTSATYNPYLTGSTLDKEAAFFGVPSFERDWLEKNAGIMGGSDEAAKAGYQRVYPVEMFTRAAEEELQDFNARINNNISLVIANMKQGNSIDDAIEMALYESRYNQIGNLIEGINRRQPAETTRALDFDYHGFKKKVEEAAYANWLRENDTKKAAELENDQVKKAEGDITQQSTAPKSQTNPGGGFWGLVTHAVKDSATWLMDVYEHEMPAYAPKQPLPEPGDAGASLPAGARQMASVGLSDAGMGPGDLEAERAALKAELDALQPTINKTAWNLQSIQEQEKAKARAKEIQAELDKLPAPTVETAPISGDYGEYSFGAPVEDWAQVQAERDAFDANKQREKDEKRAERQEAYEKLKSAEVPENYEPQKKTDVSQLLALRQKYGWKNLKELQLMMYAKAREVGPSSSFKDAEISFVSGLNQEAQLMAHMTDEEMRRYSHLYDNQGKEAAKSYLEGLKQEHLNTDLRQQTGEHWTDVSEHYPVLATVHSLLTSAAGSLEGIRVLVDNVVMDTDLEVNDPRLLNTAITQIIRETVPKDWGEAQQWWYAVGMSIADNMLRRGVMGGASLAGAFGSSASGTMEKVMAAGGTSDQAQLLGLLSGSIEMITENLQFERFTAMLKVGGGAGAREVIKGMLFGAVKNAVPEALEEGLSSILNTVADVAVRGEDSDLMKLYAHYLDEYKGDSEKAWDSVARYYVKEVGMDALGGAVSGAVFAEFAVIGKAFRTKANIKAGEVTYQKLSQNANPTGEDAQRQAVALGAQVVNSYSERQLRDAKGRERLASYQEAVVHAFAIDESDLAKVAARVTGRGAVQAETSLFEAVKTLAGMKEVNQVRVTEQVLRGNPGAGELQTLTKLNLLKEAASPQSQSLEVTQMLNDALSQKAVERMAAMPVDTGNPLVDQAIDLPGSHQKGLQYTLERWGQEGMLYISHLMESGNKLAQQVGAALQAMPTYAQSVIVAENNMRSLAITQDAVNEQIAAFAADMADPQVMENTADRAVEQAVALRSEDILGVDNLKDGAWQQAVARAMEQRQEREQALMAAEAQELDQQEAMAAAETAFQQNPADPQAMQMYQAALDDWQQTRDQVRKLRQDADKANRAHQAAQQEAEARESQAMRDARAQALAEVERLRQERSEARQAALAQQAAQEAAQQEAAQDIPKAPSPQQTAADIDRMVEERFGDLPEADKEQAREKLTRKLDERLGRKAFDDAVPASDAKNAKFMRKVEKKFGVQFVVDNTMQADEEAFFDPTDRAIHINPDTTVGDALVGVVIHELTHDAEQSGWYPQYRDAVLMLKYGDDYSDTGAFQRDIDAKIERYARSGKTLDVEQAISEIVAQETRNTLFADEAAVERLVERDPGLARRILQALNRVLERIRNSFGDAGTAEMEQARLLLEVALNERAADSRAQEDAGARPVSEAQGEYKYSLAEDGFYSKLEQEIDAIKQDKIGAPTHDSEGIELTPEQSEFFKNSKVRDEQGRLLKMYHGSPNKFTTFSREYIGSNTGRLDNGAGFYFSSEKTGMLDSGASWYGDNITEAYLDIKNPLLLTDASSIDLLKTAAQLRPDKKLDGYTLTEILDVYSDVLNREFNVSDGARDNSKDIQVEYDGRTYTLRNYTGNIENNREDVARYFVSSILDVSIPVRFGEYRINNEIIKKYDGVINGNEYVVFSPEQIKSVDNKNPTTDPDIRFSLTDADDAAIDAMVDQLLKQYGAIPQGENPTDLSPIPAQTSAEKNTRRFARTISESGILADRERQAFERGLVEERFSYEPISDKAAIAHAETILQRGGTDALEQSWRWATHRLGVPSKYDIAAGEKLLRMYAAEGDTRGAMQLTAELSEVMTRAGQAMQAARLLKKMTSEGRWYTIQHAVNKINENIKGPGIELNEGLVQNLLDATTDEARDKAVQALYKDAGRQIPPNWKTRLQAWRYFAMLGNLKTHGRNVLGNAVFMPAVKLKNVLAAGMEAMTGQKHRTKSLAVNRVLYRAALDDATAMKDILSGGGKMNPQSEIEQHQRSFGRSLPGRAMEKITQFNTDMLEAEDWIFLRRHYANALAGYLQANKLDMSADEATLAKARQYAVNEAQKATYRDASALASSLNDISKKGGVAGLVVEGILPFKKTPINILKRGVEYSPVGLIESLTRGTRQLQKGDITANQFIDRVASGMSGTMIAGLGMFLQSLGLIRAGFKEDKEDKFKRGIGFQEFAVEIGGVSITIDWMAPASMPLFVGATLMELLEEDYSDMKPEETFNMAITAMTQVMEPVFNLSMLEGVNRAIEAAQFNDTNAITEIMLNSGANFLTQHVPTLMGQVARTIDPVRRKAYIDKNSPLPPLAQQVIEQTQNKLPWLSSQNAPYLDIWGNEQVKESAWYRAFENLLSPAYVSDLMPDAVEQMLLEIYRQTGDPAVLPGMASKHFMVDGERIDLNSEQYTRFSQIRGEAMYGLFDQLLRNDAFQALDMQQKAGLVKNVLDYANSVGKKGIRPDYKMQKWMENAQESGDPARSMLEHREENERNAKRTQYRQESVKAVTSGDAESLSVAVEALIQSKYDENPDISPKLAMRYAKDTLRNQIEEAYLTAYKAEDEEGMIQIEDTLAEAGITYPYRDWLKKAK